MTAVIAAAGSGLRLGAGAPKAFVPLAGRPMIEWSIAAFRAAGQVGAIIAACPLGFSHGLDGDDLLVVDGGETRARSVANALALVETEVVAIHDAARPLLSAHLIDGLVDALATDPAAEGVIAAVPLTDTVKRAARAEGDPDAGRALTDNGMASAGFVIKETLDRRELWAAQTPQVFRTEALRAALEGEESASVAAATDEAMLVEAAGGRVLIHPSSAENLKVTTPLDLQMAELLLAEAPAG